MKSREKNKNWRKKILPQMFDIRPTDAEGNLDFERIRKIEKILKIQEKFFDRKIKNWPLENELAKPYRISRESRPETDEFYGKKKKVKKSFQEKQSPQVFRLGESADSAEVPVAYESRFHADDFVFAEDRIEDYISSINAECAPQFSEEVKVTEKDNKILLTGYFDKVSWRKSLFSFFSLAAAMFLVVFGIGFWKKGIDIKKSVEQNGSLAYAELVQAKEGILARDFQKSSFEFGEAYKKFGEISTELDGMGRFFVETTRFIPYLSKISSGSALAKTGQDISRVGVLAGDVLKNMDEIKNPLDAQAEPVSFLKIFQDAAGNSREIQSLLEDAQKNLEKVNLDDIPEDKRIQFINLKSRLPEARKFIGGFLSNSDIFTDVLGGNGPRKYLFLFQNNQEIRATGGFIGTYGVMDISNGRIKKFFIDGIFNPDGQLREKVVPPVPIQKISAAWSLHDSNWFPDFPVSAEKAMWFFERTGGPTVDGVITMTPAVMQKLLEITGPIELPEYGVTVDKDNFLEKIQYEVEVDYDKELNQPKQILADLAPKLLDKIFNAKNFTDIAKTLNILSDSLNEKQILIYSSNYDIEKKISELGWSGEILNADKDYLSVINTNINGFKTDGVVDEKISHVAEIQEDGSVVDEVMITRHHNGGNTEFEWWNKVNADYMRIYVPKGSQLISVEGQTREFDSPPLDYNALNFKRDPQVESEEDSIRIDEESGTRVYEDAGKTVFANWSYVSPQETTTVKYKYLLPFKISMNNTTKPADTYSLLIQKQAGSLGSKFSFHLTYPSNQKMIWQYPDNVEVSDNRSVSWETDLRTDKFIGMAFVKK